MKINRKLLSIGLTLATLASTSLMAAEWEGEAKDAWIDGKLEASYLLNTELNNFKIDTTVDNGAVTLTGTVSSELNKALAAEIASNLDGVVSVSNQLEVGDADFSLDESASKFRTRFHDMTTTASLKSSFALNPQLKALAINIDTKDGVVSLAGEVESLAAKELAGELASGYDYVSRVDNQLQVVSNP